MTRSMEPGAFLGSFLLLILTAVDLDAQSTARSDDRITPALFAEPPREARPGALWVWLNGTVDHAAMTREMEEARALGMRGFEIWDIGALIDPAKVVPAGPAFLSEGSLTSIRHAMDEAERLDLELNLIAASSWNAGGAWVTPEDGSQVLASAALELTGPSRFEGRLPLPCDEGTFHRDVHVLAVPRTEDKTIVSLDRVRDLSEHFEEDGRLTWDVPKGEWTVLRFVRRGTNQPLVVPSPNSNGLLIDHLSAGATERHMLHIVNELAKIDPEHEVLKILSHDSYEVRPGNDWTADFTQQFVERRGYDPRPYLPLLEGWKLADPDVQTRFVADYRKTVGELLVERHFRVSREVLNRHGMQLCAEAGHGGYARVDPVWALGEADIPRGEFWNGKRFWVTKEAASAAHLYGRRYVDSESFTGWRHWLDGPSHYKQLFDVALCAGLNRLTFHTFTHNPPEAGLPGYVYHAGEHFNANNTWWKQSGPMLTYMARCSHLMQQGTFVADVCFYYGDQAPNLVPPRRIDPHIQPIYELDKCLHCGRPRPIDVRPLGEGYDYDYIDAHSILERATVDPETKRIRVGEMSYALMVLPEHEHIDLAVLRKVRDLVNDGATILGRVRPTRTNTLTGYPNADGEVEHLGRELWGSGENAGAEPSSQRHGRGQVFSGGTSRQVLARLGIAPDFEVIEGGSMEGPDRIDFIHRRTENADLYFVCNSADEPRSLVCRFRDAQGRAELWCPVRGETFRARVVERHASGACDVALELPAVGSTFVIFRRAGEAPASYDDLPRDAGSPVSIAGPWTVTFQPGRRAPASVTWPTLIEWTSVEEPGVRYFSGTATYRATFDQAQAPTSDRWLDLGTVREVAEVRLDGTPLGTAWTPPFRVKVPAALLTPGSHTLEIAVTNVWNNRLVGDQFLPEDERVTSTNLKGRHRKDSPLVPSGLLGPVTWFESQVPSARKK